MTSDRGAKALAERLLDLFGDRGDRVEATKDHARIAKRILGEHGLFIPDVTKHEPVAWQDPYQDGFTPDWWIGCKCGWAREERPADGTVWLDHINP